ncbi:MAG TPA: orotidine-5'-phosphate decarboxylase [Dehalococcoidia bacterium]|nr:orotidine-5'-phosphate decarboxylase [Dehalococcoidia bacterium]
MNFIDKLLTASRRNKSLLCVGLDTDPDLIPENISVFEFNREIIEATKDLVCAYKPNLGFYEAQGIEGLQALKRTVDYIPDSIPVIADAKRGDIGNTAKGYAKAIFELYKFDAITVNPYLGLDATLPFTSYPDKGVFILCRTSNPGAVDFQSLLCETDDGKRPLYEIVAIKASELNTNGNVGLVIGATYPEEMKVIRGLQPDMPFLIPGIGAQGGDLEATVRYGVDVNGEKAVINSSRQILYASRDKDFAKAARKATIEINNKINRFLTR